MSKDTTAQTPDVNPADYMMEVKEFPVFPTGEYELILLSPIRTTQDKSRFKNSNGEVGGKDVPAYRWPMIFDKREYDEAKEIGEDSEIGFFTTGVVFGAANGWLTKLVVAACDPNEIQALKEGKESLLALTGRRIRATILREVNQETHKEYNRISSLGVSTIKAYGKA